MKRISLLIALTLVGTLLIAACNLNSGQATTPTPTQTSATAPVTTTVVSTPAMTATVATTASANSTATGIITAGATMTPSGPATTAIITATRVATTVMQTTTPTATAMMTVAPGTADVFRTISTIKGLETLNSALIATNLVSELDVTTRTFTIFAPNNEAFAAMPTALRESAMANPALLRNILLYHVVVDSVTEADLLSLGSALTALGENVTVTNTNGITRVNNAAIIQPDLPASNGLIHVIDAVLLPASVLSGTTAITNTGTPTATGNVTGTAPITGAGVPTTANASQIITTDVSGLTIAQVISSTPDLKTLGLAIQAGGMITALNGTGPLTLFAPTNEAFASSLPSATLNSLLNTPTSLVNVLQYHIVADRTTAADLARLGIVLSTQGSPITVTVTSDGLLVNNIAIGQADIVASNGVIHLINGVLTPPAQ